MMKKSFAFEKLLLIPRYQAKIESFLVKGWNWPKKGGERKGKKEWEKVAFQMFGFLCLGYSIF